MKAKRTEKLELEITQIDLAIMLVEENGYDQTAQLAKFEIIPMPSGSLLLRGTLKEDNQDEDDQGTSTMKAGV